MEAVKQGGATAALRSKTHVVLVSLNVRPSYHICHYMYCTKEARILTFVFCSFSSSLQRTADTLSAFPSKVHKIDEHLGISVSGLAPDARVLSKYMRNECLRSRFIYSRALPVQRIAYSVAERAQISTQRYGGRPYGVGLLIGGVDVRICFSFTFFC